MKTVRSTQRKPSKLERRFATMWKLMGGPVLTPEYRFDDVRRWRFDFALPEIKTAFELDGGAHPMWKRTKTGRRYMTMGGHNTPKGYRNGCEKSNAATAAGWAVYRLTGDMIKPSVLDDMLQFALERGAERVL